MESSKRTESLPKAYDPAAVESKWYAYWEERGYFRADAKSDKPPFAIVMPPPNVTGSLHMGHALTATIQDLVVRWHRMRGFETLWLPGTDHAGIATQMVVERELKQKEGKSRHDLGREAFLERVWAWKEQYGSRITEQHKALGASCDWSRERFTMDEGLSRAVREVFVRLYEEGLLYRDTRLINWCPTCLTALSDLEVEHVETEGHLWHIAYPVEGTDRRLVVATTRPETMLGDTAVAVHPEDARYADLIGKEVRLPLVDRRIPIVADPVLVDMEFGTGAVKVTPAHDFNDFETGKRHGLEEISVLDEHGRINENGGPYAGLDRFEARERIVADLEAKGLLEKVEAHTLSVGHCQRCETVVEPRLSQQWFVKAKVLAEPAIEAVETGRTTFVPKSWEKTYFHWMRNIQDWCVSRQLWWGHRIPAWYCDACGEITVARVDPERCAHCGSTEIHQDEDVLDTWFSSALWPFSTLGWPDETDDLKKFYPQQLMETGFDIIFFWVARMMMMGLHFMGEVPFTTVYLHAMVRDEKGQKMSKTKGNVIDPLDVTRRHGADALRFTLASMAGQGRDIKLSLERVAGYQAFANKIWNAARFALMNLEDHEQDDRAPWEAGALHLADRWILTRLDRALEQVDRALKDYAFDEAARTVYRFFWHELCDWYIELSKPALRGALGEEAKQAARRTLVHVLDASLRMLHPFMPFVTEEIWQKLPLGRSRPTDSIMIAPFPQAEPGRRDEAGEAAMQPLIEAIRGVRTIRGESRIPPREKIEVVVQAESEAVRRTFAEYEDYLLGLTGAGVLRIEAPGEAPPKAAAFVAPGLQVFVPLEGIVDLDEEIARLEKARGKVARELAGLEGRLRNENFVKRAPAEVVEEARARVKELTDTAARIDENLKRLTAA
ncbi:MAG: valine--tRNA ligase [Deltaproteobacteria bacterium]|nr:MAG: valine--tRNA ligase [Deltaproteobacteria bacterium]